MIYRLFFVIFFVAFLSVLPQTSKAELVVGWDVAGVELDDTDTWNAPYNFGATTSVSNASGNMRLGAGVNPTTNVDQYGFKISGSNEQTSLAGAIDNDHYIEFSVTVDSGYLLNLENLTFNGDSSSSGADDIVLMSSIDGFSVNNEISSLTGRSNGTAGEWDTDASGFGDPIDLTAARYQGLNGTVAFRIYGYNTSDGSGITHFRNLSGNDVVINGSIVLASIPEPTSFLMFGAVMVGVSVRRRR